jgi:hypothetical protein
MVAAADLDLIAGVPACHTEIVLLPASRRIGGITGIIAGFHFQS